MKQNPESDVQPSVAPVVTVAPRQKVQRIIFAFSVVTIVVVAALLNPSQDRHFEEIDKIIRRREAAGDDTGHMAINVLASYNNYFLFSTVTFGGNKLMDDNHILSYGFLGSVKTTGNIKTVMLAIYEWNQNQKKAN